MEPIHIKGLTVFLQCPVPSISLPICKENRLQGHLRMKWIGGGRHLDFTAGTQSVLSCIGSMSLRPALLNLQSAHHQAPMSVSSSAVNMSQTISPPEDSCWPLFLPLITSNFLRASSEVSSLPNTVAKASYFLLILSLFASYTTSLRNCDLKLSLPWERSKYSNHYKIDIC